MLGEANAMNTTTFNGIRHIVYQESGIRLQDGKETMVAARLRQRLAALDLPDAEAYLDHLQRRCDDELVLLLDAISTNVTSFFREAEHFRYLSELLEHGLQSGRRRFRIWCAASSTGEEPYSIAMTASQVFGQSNATVDWQVLATDISTKVLAVAKDGTYSSTQVESIPSHLLRSAFERTARTSSEWRVRPELRERVMFRRLNLSKTPFAVKGPLDAVLCRNVMIYFDTPIRSRIIGEFARVIRPEGQLIVGKSESLKGIQDSFDRQGPSVYRRIDTDSIV